MSRLVAENNKRPTIGKRCEAMSQTLEYTLTSVLWMPQIRFFSGDGVSIRGISSAGDGGAGP
jgi:hypothetical protein